MRDVSICVKSLSKDDVLDVIGISDSFPYCKSVIEAIVFIPKNNNIPAIKLEINAEVSGKIESFAEAERLIAGLFIGGANCECN